MMQYLAKMSIINYIFLLAYVWIYNLFKNAELKRLCQVLFIKRKALIVKYYSKIVTGWFYLTAPLSTLYTWLETMVINVDFEASVSMEIPDHYSAHWNNLRHLSIWLIMLLYSTLFGLIVPLSIREAGGVTNVVIV